MNAGIDARAGLREEHTAQHCDGRSATDTDAGEAVRQDARNLLIAHRRLKDLLETHHIGDVAKDKAADLWSIGELIVAAFVVSMKEEGGLSDFYQYDNFLSEEEFDSYISEIKRNSLYETDVVPEYGQPLITLVTCEYSRDEGRFVVVASLKNQNKANG